MLYGPAFKTPHGISRPIWVDCGDGSWQLIGCTTPWLCAATGEG